MIGLKKCDIKYISKALEDAIKISDTNVIEKLQKKYKGLELTYIGDNMVESNIEFTGRYNMDGYLDIKSLKEGVIFTQYTDMTVGADIHCYTIDNYGYYETEYIKII